MTSLPEPRRSPKPGDIQPQPSNAHSRRPAILVLLASCNGQQWIAQQIESILAQEDVDVVVRIRDDGSSDGTLREIARFAPDSRVHLCPSSKPTGSAAQNFFALIRDNAAQGFDFVALADQDDIWYRERLARATRALEDPQIAGYSSATLARWGNSRERVIALSGRPNRSDFLFEGAGQGCTFVLTADLYERIRGFISAMPEVTANIHYHDWAIYALARSWGLRWTFDAKPALIYRQHDNNDTGARGTLCGVRKRLTLIRNGWYKQQLERVCDLCATAAPKDSRIAELRAALRQRRRWRRTALLLRFCLVGGRRSPLDNCVLLVACVAGWV